MQNLNEKIAVNEELLKNMIEKKENLERQISNLQRKIENQKFARDHQRTETKKADIDSCN